MSSRRGIRGEGRERLIDAAAECFSKDGPGAMTIDQVCSRANASVGTVYHHFPGGLRDLEDSLYLDTLTGYQKGLLSELERHRSASAGVKAAVIFHLDWMTSNLPLTQYLLFFNPSWLAPQRFARLEAMNAEFARAVDQWREPFVSSGKIRRLPGMFYGAIILGPAHQYVGDLITKVNIEDVPAAVRSASRPLADAAWLAVKGEEV